jgi:hypothetical protein
VAAAPAGAPATAPASALLVLLLLLLLLLRLALLLRGRPLVRIVPVGAVHASAAQPLPSRPRLSHAHAHARVHACMSIDPALLPHRAHAHAPQCDACRR